MSPVSGRAARWAELEAACLEARGGGGAAARTQTAPPPGPSPGPGASRTSTPSLYHRWLVVHNLLKIRVDIWYYHVWLGDQALYCEVCICSNGCVHCYGCCLSWIWISSCSLSAAMCGLLALMMDSVDSNNLIIICKLFRKAGGNNVMADNGMLDHEQYHTLSVVLLPISTVTTAVWRHPLTR